MERVFRRATQELTGLLATALSKAKVPPGDAPSWRIHIRYGSPRAVVDKITRKTEADLLMLGTRAYSGQL